MGQLAPLQTITVSPLLRLLISLSANDVIVLFLAPGIAVPVTSYYFPIKFAISVAQPWAWLLSVNNNFLLFLFNMQGACGFYLVLLFRELYISITYEVIQYSIAVCYHWNRFMLLHY